MQACQRRAALFGARLSVGKRTLVNVGQHTTLGDGDVTQQLVQLLIVADGELQVAGDDTGLLVVAGGVASQLENLGSEVLEDGSQVDRGTSTDTLGIVALAQETVDTTDGERQTGLGGTTTDRICQRLMIRGGGLEVGTRDKNALQRLHATGGRKVLTIARSWSRWPCRRTCLQSFWMWVDGLGKWKEVDDGGDVSV